MFLQGVFVHCYYLSNVDTNWLDASSRQAWERGGLRRCHIMNSASGGKQNGRAAFCILEASLSIKWGLSVNVAARMVKVYINAWKLFGNSYFCK